MSLYKTLLDMQSDRTDNRTIRMRLKGDIKVFYFVRQAFCGDKYYTTTPNTNELYHYKEVSLDRLIREAVTTYNHRQNRRL